MLGANHFKVFVYFHATVPVFDVISHFGIPRAFAVFRPAPFGHPTKVRLLRSGRVGWYKSTPFYKSLPAIFFTLFILIILLIPNLNFIFTRVGTLSNSKIMAQQKHPPQFLKACLILEAAYERACTNEDGRLPTLRSLAKSAGIGAGIMAVAVSKLKREGKIEGAPRAGLRVKPVIPTTSHLPETPLGAPWKRAAQRLESLL